MQCKGLPIVKIIKNFSIFFLQKFHPNKMFTRKYIFLFFLSFHIQTNFVSKQTEPKTKKQLSNHYNGTNLSFHKQSKKPTEYINLRIQTHKIKK